MGAHIQWLNQEYSYMGIVRAGSEFSEYGDPYEFSFVVIVQGDTAHLVGGTGKLTKKLADEIATTLAKEEELKYITWERRRKNADEPHIAGPFKLDKWR